MRRSDQTKAQLYRMDGQTTPFRYYLNCHFWKPTPKSLKPLHVLFTQLNSMIWCGTGLLGSYAARRKFWHSWKAQPLSCKFRKGASNGFVWLLIDLETLLNSLCEKPNFAHFDCFITQNLPWPYGIRHERNLNTKRKQTPNFNPSRNLKELAFMNHLEHYYEKHLLQLKDRCKRLLSTSHWPFAPWPFHPSTLSPSQLLIGWWQV